MGRTLKPTTARAWLCAFLLFAATTSAFAQLIPKVTVGEPSGIDQLNPLTNFSAAGSYINEYLYFSLMRSDKRTGAFLPLVANEPPKVSSDNLTYTYLLNPAAKFNSGKKVLAADVVFSLKLIKNPYVNNAQKRVHYENIASAEALDDNTVLIKLHKPSPEGMRITSDFAILAQEAFDPDHRLDLTSVQGLGNPNALSQLQLEALKLVGERVNATGTSLQTFPTNATCAPYLLLDWKRNEKIVLQANKKFWGRKLDTAPNAFFKQNVDVIEIKAVSSEAAVRMGLFDNSLDVVTGVQPNLFFELRDVPKLQGTYTFQTPPGAAYEYIGLNMKGASRGRPGITDDLQVRKALAHLVPVEMLLERVRFGLGERIAAEIPGQDPSFKNPDLALPDFNPRKAREILTAAGWEDSDGNGILDKKANGEELSMVVECIYNDNKPYRAVIAEEFQKAARDVGILLNVQALSWDAYKARLTQGDFDMVIGAWVSDPNEKSFQQIWHTKSWGQGSNFVGFGDSRSDDLVEQFDAAIDPQKRKEIGYRIQQIQADTQPYIFLWSETNSLIVSKKFSNAGIGIYRPGFWIGEWE